MRFTKRKEMKEGYCKGFRKTKTKFLWLPVTIDGETRWLEEARIVYRIDWDYDLFNDKYYYWEAWKFEND